MIFPRSCAHILSDFALCLILGFVEFLQSKIFTTFESFSLVILLVENCFHISIIFSLNNSNFETCAFLNSVFSVLVRFRQFFYFPPFWSSPNFRFLFLFSCAYSPLLSRFIKTILTTKNARENLKEKLTIELLQIKHSMKRI